MNNDHTSAIRHVDFEIDVVRRAVNCDEDRVVAPFREDRTSGSIQRNTRANRRRPFFDQEVGSDEDVSRLGERRVDVGLKYEGPDRRRTLIRQKGVAGLDLVRPAGARVHKLPRRGHLELVEDRYVVVGTRPAVAACGEKNGGEQQATESSQ